MSAFDRDQHRFFCQGLMLSAATDTMPQGKWPVLQNVRSYQTGTIQPRDGLTLLTSGLGAAVHTLARLADPTPFASIPSRLLFGAGGSIFTGPPGGAWPSADAGYSGSPLSILAIQPTGSPQPWLYVADTLRMRKFNVNGLVYPIGIAAPPAEPAVSLFTIGINLIASFNTGVSGWASVGTAASGIVTQGRINTTITAIYYDSGTSGNCSIVPADLNQIGEGMMLLLNGADLVQVNEITIAIAPTTIAAIIYDNPVSNTGLCTIQPAASLGTGQLFDLRQTLSTLNSPGVSSPDPGLNSILQRTTALDVSGLPNPFQFDPAGPVARIRQSDFPVNSLVTLGGSETVRILSIATGPDGVQSFRCSTAGTFAAGATLTGTAAFRAWVPNTYTAGMAIFDQAVRNGITPPAPVAPATTSKVTAGIESAVVAQNLAQIVVGGDTRAILGEDDLHLAVRIDDLTVVKTIRVYFDVDPLVNDFTRNYYFFEWKVPDIIAAIQSTNTANVAALADAGPPINSSTPLPTTTTPLPFGGSIEKGGTILQPPTRPVQSNPLALGNNQWIDMHCKISQLIHVGTESSKTLADVQRVEVLISIDSATAITVDYDTLYISGGYAPDVGNLGNTFKYRYSYRSSTTGARSNPSPQSRAGVQAKRQLVIAVGALSSDPQCDLIDWWRMGGALTAWTYDGTAPNAVTAEWHDVFGDAAIDGGETLVFDNFQPWPSTDLPRSGTCNVAGNALRWVSGDHFDPSWSEGTAIVVNGRTYTLYGQPPTSTLLFLNENAGSGAAVAFFVPGATLVSQPFPVLFGGPIGGTIFTFGVGDPRNPGAIYWTKGNNPEAASDRNSLLVTAPSEPLMNGWVYDGLPYVFSSDNLYVVEPDFSQPQQFRALITPCGRGLWCRWGSCLTPFGIAFIAKDGICLTRSGSAAQSLTDKDLYPLFPHDGIPGVAVNGYAPPDMAQTTKLKLAFVDGWLYFDYQDTLGAGHTLCLRMEDQSWWPDLSTPGITARYAEPGDKTHQMLLGGTNGSVYTPGGLTDDGTAILCKATVVENQKDARAQKLYRDVLVEADMGGANTLTLALALTNGTVGLSTASFVGAAGRKPYWAAINPTTMDAYGVNLQLAFSFAPASVTGPAPILYLYDIGFQLEPELATNWLSGPTTHGLPGYQQVPLVLLAYLSSGPVTFNVRIDGTLYQYTLPSTGGVYAKKFFRLVSVKGLTFQYGFQASAQAAFMLFDRDCEVWVQPWGTGGGYQKVKPFTGPYAGSQVG